MYMMPKTLAFLHIKVHQDVLEATMHHAAEKKIAQRTGVRQQFIYLFVDARKIPISQFLHGLKSFCKTLPYLFNQTVSKYELTAVKFGKLAPAGRQCGCSLKPTFTQGFQNGPEVH